MARESRGETRGTRRVFDQYIDVIALGTALIKKAQTIRDPTFVPNNPKSILTYQVQLFIFWKRKIKEEEGTEMEKAKNHHNCWFLERN